MGLERQPVDASPSQQANRAWWEAHPMTYDWHGTLRPAPGSREWFAEIDRRFLSSAYFATTADGTPFGRFLNPADVAGKAVLEVGCGMGLHAAMLARARARLTAVDLTARAVDVTRQRFSVFCLPGHIGQADAENLPFPDARFDMVWSWGVIHHSRSFERCMEEITRVLRPGGRLLLMVYHRQSLAYFVHAGLIRGVLLGGLVRQRLKDLYTEAADGAYARVFSRDELRELLEPAYEPISLAVVGLKAELWPIPRCRAKDVLERITPNWSASAILSRWGSMLVAQAVKRRGVPAPGAAR